MEAAPLPPLPQRWTEAVDPDGRLYYVDQVTKTTKWERPIQAVSGLRQPPPGPPPPYYSDATMAQRSIQAVSGLRRPPPGPPPYHHSTPTTVQCQPPEEGILCTCKPRATFWVAAAFSCVVWALGAWASAGDSWFQEVDFSAGNSRIYDGCGNEEFHDRFCNLYMAFTTMQLIGSLVVTVCVALLMIAAFRPGASGCCNTPGLGFAGGYLMVLYAVCQIFAFALVIAIAKRQDDYGNVFNEIEINLGATFAVAVSSSILAVIDAILIFLFEPYAGEGPAYACISTCFSASNNYAQDRRRIQPEDAAAAGPSLAISGTATYPARQALPPAP